MISADVSPGESGSTAPTSDDGDPAGQSRVREPVVDVVESIAAHTGVDPIELPPLQEHVDTDALNAIVSGRSAGVEVSFTYAGLGVTVHDTGAVDVVDLTDATGR